MPKNKNKNENATNRCLCEQELEEAALKQFQFRTQKQVLANLCTYISEAEAQEVFQDSLFKIFVLAKKNPSDQPLLDKLLSLQPMLFTISKNSAITKLRHKQVREKYLADQYLKNYSVLTESLEAELSKESDMGLLKEAIRTLPPICQKIFVARKIHEKSHLEIAEKYNISKKTVENHIANGIKLCRKYIVQHTKSDRMHENSTVSYVNKRA